MKNENGLLFAIFVLPRHIGFEDLVFVSVILLGAFVWCVVGIAGTIHNGRIALHQLDVSVCFVPCVVVLSWYNVFESHFFAISCVLRVLLLFFLHLNKFRQIRNRGTAESVGHGDGPLTAARNVMRNMYPAELLLHAHARLGVVLSCKHGIQDGLSGPGLYAHAILLVPGSDHRVLEGVAFLGVGVEICHHDSSLVGHEGLGRIQRLLPFGDHRQRITETDGVETAIDVVSADLGEFFLDVGVVDVEADPPDLFALLGRKGLAGRVFSDGEQFRADIQNNNLVESFELGTEKVDVASGSTTNV
mmetsp:Transcript_25573/g.54590  ORF Transcript_25573/g.54590 Transcript_25573/m.54590 type:complete len:303 (-) Transcript_25573:624-1532(-)